MSQRLGRPAQDHFKLLCSQARVTCNSSLEDDHGWDFIIELTPPQDADKPADKTPGVKKALIQVKSTYGKIPTTRIKIANALKFAKDDLPCFLVLFHYTKDLEPQVYVRHFWKELIARALKRARQASAENRSIHKIEMQVLFSGDDNHTNDHISWIISMVHDNQIDYSSTKRTLYETIGYEDRKYRAELAFGPIKGIEEVVDHQLGLTEYLPVSKIRLIDSRFGIDAPVPILESERGRIQIRPNDIKGCTLALQNSTGDLLLFETSVRIPIIPNLPTDKFKIAMKTWCFVAVVDGDGSFTLEVKILWNEKMSMEKLRDFSQFLSWGGKELSLKLSGEQIPTLSFRGRFSSIDHEILFGVLSRIAGTLRDIQVRAGTTTVELSLSDLRGSLGELKFFCDVLTARDMQLYAEGGPPLNADVPLCSLLSYFEFNVGGYFYFVVVTTRPCYQRHARRERSEWPPAGCNPGSPWTADSLRFGNRLRRTFGCGSILRLSA